MWKQYPENTEIVFSYIEARNLPKGVDDEVVFFGLQAFIQDYLQKPITEAEVRLADKYWTAHGEPFNLKGWLKLVGKPLPIKIRAVEEGTVIPSKNVLCTIENTDPEFWWLTTWVETALLRALWYPSSVATLSRNIRKVILKYLVKTGTPELLDFKLHDFGARGCSSNETAALGGMSHLASGAKGTDTYVGVLKAIESYGASFEICGFSIPAAEHSTITSWGRENEILSYDNQLNQFAKPGAIHAVVSDSYSIFEAAKMWVTMKDKIVASGATLVIRPDSGDPVEVLTKLMEILAAGFGFETNAKGYDVLNNVRVIWGDGINLKSIKRILTAMCDDLGWSADNFAFGMGGALLQGPMRDDYGWAMKCSAIAVREYTNGSGTDDEGKLVWRDVFKDPITAPGKASKKGRVTLYKRHDGTFYSGAEDWMPDALNTIFLNGELVRYVTFDKVRANAAIPV